MSDATQALTARSGARAEIEEELPRLRLLVGEARLPAAGAADGRLAGGCPGAAARTVQPLPGGARGGDPPRTGAGRLPGLLPPDRPRPGRRAHADRGGGARADAARRLPLGRPARGRAADRPARYRRARVGARRRRRRRPAGDSREPARASRSGAPPDAPLLPAGRLVVADGRRALAVLFGELAPAHQPGAQDAPR